MKEIKYGISYNNCCLNVINNSYRNKSKILFNCINNRRLYGTVKSYDEMNNMLLGNVRELWLETPKSNKDKEVSINLVYKYIIL